MKKEYSIFCLNTKKSPECYIALKPNQYCDFDEQLNNLVSCCYSVFNEFQISISHIVFARIYISDYKNQIYKLNDHALLKSILCECAVSVIEQPPLNNSKINIILNVIKRNDVNRLKDGNLFVYENSNYLHLYQLNSVVLNNPYSVFKQTESIYQEYINNLKKYDMTMLDNTIRTWLYINNIDRNYSDVVDARNKIFINNGLNKNTHFITSTGIEGNNYNIDCGICVDFYAIKGLSLNQIRYLNAPEYLNQSYNYGVSFERGICIYYGDRKHIYISGTASIDKNGICLHEKNVIMQTKRLFKNIQMLLRDANAELNDIACMTIYIRDIADYKIVDKYLKKKFRNTPYIVNFGKVCRPEWLIEVECIALKIYSDKLYPQF